MTDFARRADVPETLKPLVSRIVRDAAPLDVWLFGSRARGEARADSDWDLLVLLPDDADNALLDPLFGWRRQRSSGVQADVRTATRGDLDAVWNVPNTIGYVLAQEGIRLNVSRCGDCCSVADRGSRSRRCARSGFLKIECLTSSATSYRYPTLTGRIPAAPTPSELAWLIDETDSLLRDVAGRFGIDLT